MKYTCKLFIFVCAFLTLSASAHAQSPREQLTQLAQQLQATPTDNALRERVIKLGAEIKPAPAIPEEANRAFVKGGVFQKEAKDPAGSELAVSAYREALRIAPWWGDAYFNLAVALESANKFDEAIAATRSYLASIPTGSAEAREAQNRVYALEAKGEMASKATKAAETQAKAKASTTEGDWGGFRVTQQNGQFIARRTDSFGSDCYRYEASATSVGWVQQPIREKGSGWTCSPTGQVIVQCELSGEATLACRQTETDGVHANRSFQMNRK